MLWRRATGMANPAPTRIPNPLARSLLTPVSIRMFERPAPPRRKKPFSAGNQVSAARKLVICKCASLPASVPPCPTADTLPPSRRFGLRATPALTMFSATSEVLSVAVCRLSLKVIVWPFTLYFAPNPGPMPLPMYQWDQGFPDRSASAAVANPAIAKDKPATAAMRQDEFMTPPWIDRRLWVSDRSRLSVTRILHPASRPVKQARELHVRDQSVGHGLDDLPVGTGETVVSLEAHQRAQPLDHPAQLRARVPAFIVHFVRLGELVQPRDQRRQHAQPLERRILEHEREQLAPGLDASVLALVADSLRVEQRFVELQQRVPQLVELGGVGLGHGVPVYRNRPSWGRIAGFPLRGLTPGSSSGPREAS